MPAWWCCPRGVTKALFAHIEDMKIECAGDLSIHVVLAKFRTKKKNLILLLTPALEENNQSP